MLMNFKRRKSTKFDNTRDVKKKEKPNAGEKEIIHFSGSFSLHKASFDLFFQLLLRVFTILLATGFCFQVGSFQFRNIPEEFNEFPSETPSFKDGNR